MLLQRAVVRRYDLTSGFPISICWRFFVTRALARHFRYRLSLSNYTHLCPCINSTTLKVPSYTSRMNMGFLPYFFAAVIDKDRWIFAYQEAFLAEHYGHVCPILKIHIWCMCFLRIFYNFVYVIESYVAHWILVVLTIRIICFVEVSRGFFLLFVLQLLRRLAGVCISGTCAHFFHSSSMICLVPIQGTTPYLFCLRILGLWAEFQVFFLVSVHRYVLWNRWMDTLASSSACRKFASSV